MYSKFMLSQQAASVNVRRGSEAKGTFTDSYNVGQKQHRVDVSDTDSQFERHFEAFF